MDAYDIFKTLRQGAKTTRKKENLVLLSNHKSYVANDNDPIITQIKVEKETNTSEDETSNPTVTLLGPITASEIPKPKRKKRKMLDENTKSLLIQEEINHYRNVEGISVVGRHIPNPIKSFDELSITAHLRENIRDAGYTDPTSIQKQAIPAMLNNRQILGCAPTGSGKTAAFLIPIIHTLKAHEKRACRAVIICPTRELAKQTQNECIRLSEGSGLRVHTINKIGKAVSENSLKSFQKFDIMVTTPNRLCFLLKQDPPVVTLSNVEWLIIDEADKLFEEGVRSFRDQLNEILASCTNSARKIAMFSATYTPVVAKWCVHNMKGLIRITVGQRNAAVELVEQELLFVGNEQGKLLAFRDIIRKGVTPPILVFVQSKERAQQLFSELVYDGVNVDAIHADRTQLQRDNTVKSFREGRVWILICTELMARGIDFKGVNLVINYDFPPSAISYVHRIGRAGRAGRAGMAITFFTTDDTVNLRSIAQVIRQSGCEVPDYMLTIKKRSKKKVKQLKVSAPQRDDILTVPKREREKIAKMKKKKLESHQISDDSKMKLKKKQKKRKTDHK